MSEVKIRKDGSIFLAYFVEFRKILTVNEIASKIIDLFFNKNRTVKEIISFLSKEIDVSIEKSSILVKDLLKDIAIEIESQSSEDFSRIEVVVPLGVEICITDSCNLRCKHCLQTDYPEKYMDYVLFERVVRLLSSKGVFEINIVGGEPFRHPRIIDFLKLCINLGFCIDIVMRVQQVSAPLIASNGVLPFSLFLGRQLSSRSTKRISSSEIVSKSVFFGK